MKLLKADNYQTWYIEEGENAVLIDPWLSNQLQPDNSTFIQRKRNEHICLDAKDVNKVKASDAFSFFLRKLGIAWAL